MILFLSSSKGFLRTISGQSFSLSDIFTIFLFGVMSHPLLETFELGRAGKPRDAKERTRVHLDLWPSSPRSWCLNWRPAPGKKTTFH